MYLYASLTCESDTFLTGAYEFLINIRGFFHSLNSSTVSCFIVRMNIFHASYNIQQLIRKTYISCPYLWSYVPFHLRCILAANSQSLSRNSIRNNAMVILSYLGYCIYFVYDLTTLISSLKTVPV